MLESSYSLVAQLALETDSPEYRCGRMEGDGCKTRGIARWGDVKDERNTVSNQL